MTNALGFPSYELHGNGQVITFNSGTADANGCYWWLDGELGGWDSPEGRVTMLPKIGAGPAGDGETPADLHYKGRTITFCLFAECPSQAAREACRHLLTEVLDLTDTTGLFLANEVAPVQCSIVRAGNTGQGKTTIIDQGFAIKASETQTAVLLGGLGGLPLGETAFVFKAEIEVYAEDPRKYFQTALSLNGSSGVASFTNNGNTETQNAVLSISTAPGTGGPALHVTVAGPGYSQTMILVTPTVPGGAPPLSGFPSTTVLDFYNKRITDGGSGNFYYLRDLTTPWPAFPPGAVTITTNPLSGFTGSLYPAFI